MMMMMMMIASYPACPPTPGCAGCHRWIHKPSSWHRCLKFLQTPATHQEQSRATWITENHCTTTTKVRQQSTVQEHDGCKRCSSFLSQSSKIQNFFSFKHCGQVSDNNSLPQKYSSDNSEWTDAGWTGFNQPPNLFSSVRLAWNRHFPNYHDSSIFSF